MTSTPIAVGPELVDRAKRGDQDGLRELVTAAYPMVRRWALLRTGDPADADDLTQDVMIQIIRKLDGFRGDAGFSTWVYAVTRRAAAERARRARRRADVQADPRAVEAVTPRSPTDPAEEAERDDPGRVVRSGFLRLPLRQREVFDLVELQGLTASEAAARLGIEAVSVRAHLFKARRALRAHIVAHHPGLREDTP